MIRTVEAVVDTHGMIRILTPVELPVGRRVLVTILEEASQVEAPSTALLSEPALAVDWSRPEEDSAWSCLQPDK